MLQEWLKRRMRFRTYLILLPVLVLFCMGIANGGRTFVRSVDPDIELSGKTVNYRVVLQTKQIHEMAPRSFVWVPIKEEFQYRLVPFGIVWILWLLAFGSRPPIAATGLLVITTSAYFGYIHGGVGNIFIQGAVGVVLALVLLKVSGYGSAPLKGAAAAIMLHGAHNLRVALETQLFMDRL